jgi:hypothetical protein
MGRAGSSGMVTGIAGIGNAVWTNSPFKGMDIGAADAFATAFLILRS